MSCVHWGMHVGTENRLAIAEISRNSDAFVSSLWNLALVLVEIEGLTKCNNVVKKSQKEDGSWTKTVTRNEYFKISSV